jgi:hypothetical protein
MLYSTERNHIFVLSINQHISAEPTNSAKRGVGGKAKKKES